MDREINAKAKYLKYKAKYEQLKQQLEEQQVGLITAQSGWHTYFLNKEFYETIKSKIQLPDGKAPSNSDINDLLELKAIRVKSFSKTFRVVSGSTFDNMTKIGNFFNIKDKLTSVWSSTSFNLDKDLKERFQQCANDIEKEQVKRTQQLVADKDRISQEYELRQNYLANNEREFNNIRQASTNMLETYKNADKLVIDRIKELKLNEIVERNTRLALGKPNDYSVPINYSITININRFGKNDFYGTSGRDI